MSDYDRRASYGRKRRHRDDDDQHRRNQRRQTDEHVFPHVRIRKQLLGLADSPQRRWHDEVYGVAGVVWAHADDAKTRSEYTDLTLQMILQHPLKIPFVAAVVLLVNARNPEVVAEILRAVADALEKAITGGEWRDVKLYLKFLACLQSCLDGEGIFPLLEEFWNRAVELQTASSEDTIGTELVKIILLTIPYIIASSSDQWQQKAADLIDKTDVIASEPHALQALIDPYFTHPSGQTVSANISVISLLQNQLQYEAVNGWELLCIPRPWKLPLAEVELQDQVDNATKHALPTIAFPATMIAGPRPLFPEVYFSVYANQEVESVPPISNIAASLVRDALLDTINVLDVNRNISTRFLMDVDFYFADDTFVKRGTPFDRLRDVEPGRSMWKPEDVGVDAVFSQIFQLPVPERKVVYYHSVLTEGCKLAPAAIAPSLGRAIRFLYRSVSKMDMELAHRFTDWFSHHLSNFGFMWKWIEWVDDVALPDLHPCKAFILGALDKEVRLSFAQRIRQTLPAPYQALIGPEKDKDVPEFKFNDPVNAFSASGREIAALLKRKVPDEDFQPVIEQIHSAALDQSLDPLVTSTDVFMTAVCWVGSKSLSHVLACIDRTQGRLIDVGSASERAREQIITAVFEHWKAYPGVAVAIVEKLLNYSILTPMSVAQWALEGQGSNGGEALAQPHMFELVFNTVAKVTGRVRQVVGTSTAAPQDGDAEVVPHEVAAMRHLFAAIEGSLTARSTCPVKDDIMDVSDSGVWDTDGMIIWWAARWLRVFQRKRAMEEAFLIEAERERGRRKSVVEKDDAEGMDEMDVVS